MNTTFTNSVFEEVVVLPNVEARERYQKLVGLDEVKDRLVKEARLLINPFLLDEWSKKHHGQSISLLEVFKIRAPLFIFAGDVGTGKTALAESFGDEIARQENIPVTLYSLSLNARGTGAVGEMTKLLSEAFKTVKNVAKKAISNGKKPKTAVILLIDEADALAQSRDLGQMHHEDRAGVNALIRGIYGFATGHLPAIVVMCTNRLDVLDPAVRRRALETFEFSRPDNDQRKAILDAALNDLNLTSGELDHLVQLTGPQNGTPYGHTYSDLVQRLLPSILLDAFPDKPISYDRILKVIQAINPTPPFKADGLK